MNPPILVLDDATSAIDVQIEQQIHAALERLMTGRTTLIIAHRLSTISLADRVAVVDGGRVIAARHAQPSCSRTEPRYAEILAQAEADDEERVHEGAVARSTAEHDRERVLAAAIAADVAGIRELDDEVGADATSDPAGANPVGRV